MIITELLNDYAPRLGKPKYKGAAARAKRFIKSLSKKASRAVTRFVRAQYFLAAALRDLKAAAGRNEDIVIAGVVGAFIITYGLAVSAMEFFITTFGAAFEMADTTGIDTGLLTLVVGLTLFGLGSLLSAFWLNFLSIAVMDGAHRKVHRSIRSTTRRSLNAASRVASSWVLVGAALAARALGIILVAFVYGRWLYDSFAIPLPLLIVLGLAAAFWLVISALRYSLVPYVALFEPQLLLTDAFARSRQLVKKQAWLFLISLYTALAAYLAALEYVSEPVMKWLGSPVNLLFPVGALAGIVLANGAMAMLYLKRKRARLA
jgi:hypothetical protein